jgi:hypothetical protein
MALVSFRHGFVFIKVPKTAGTSIEADLSGHMGPDDVVTPILPPIEGHHPRNYEDAAGNSVFYNHMPATGIRALIGKTAYDGMLSFCVEREPVAKCISHFHMLRNSKMHAEGADAVESWDDYVERGRFLNAVHLYSEMVDGTRRLMVDRVLRYERLETELPALMAERGIAGFCLTTRAKSEYSRNVLVRPEDVTPAQRQKIRDAFAESTRVTGIDWDA